jgi:hypothetical protein
MVVASVSLVALFSLAAMMYGTASILHSGTIGWLAVLAVILIPVVTINAVMAPGSSHLKRLHEQPPF